jgi:hypothetical protein
MQVKVGVKFELWKVDVKNSAIADELPDEESDIEPKSVTRLIHSPRDFAILIY